MPRASVLLCTFGLLLLSAMVSADLSFEQVEEAQIREVCVCVCGLFGSVRYKSTQRPDAVTRQLSQIIFNNLTARK